MRSQQEIDMDNQEYMDWLYDSAPELRNLTGSELSGAIERYGALTYEKNVTDKSVELKLNHFYDAFNSALEPVSQKAMAERMDSRQAENNALMQEIKELLVNKKWYYSIFDGIDALYVAISHSITDHIVELAERYEDTLPTLSALVDDYEARVKSHLERMGFKW